MKKQNTGVNNTQAHYMRPALVHQMAFIQEKCIECPNCVTQCAFLKKYGTPKTIAAAFDPSDIFWLTLAYECSLCDLCEVLCPVNLTPGAMFLELRREAVDRGIAPLPVHKSIMAYEGRGISPRYSWYSLPARCHTVFFPGCTFSGTRMDTTIALYEYLKTKNPDMGIVLDCCGKPSHDLGRSDFFASIFSEMQQWLVENGVKTVIVVCPNCYKVFAGYGAPLEVISVYEFLNSNGLPETTRIDAPGFLNPLVSIHDPCALRNEAAIQAAVRNLAIAKGFSIEEMPHSKKKTLCCGEGGAVGCVAPEFSSAWGDLRQKESGGRRLLTYCAGCTCFLDRKTPTDHILDAVFHPEEVASGKRKAAKAPLTYFHRIRLKRYVQKNHPASVTRERNFSPAAGKTGAKGGSIIKILILMLVAVAIAGIHFSGALRYFDPETLRRGVASLGALAPAAYILLYTIAPSLFLPGLPITFVGGILFGPVWGVVYAITGATAGACLAFLISRYAARDWIEAKLTGPRWRQLDRSVERNGWKIVAFTRLVPLFPFNLLNYAFGLTSIRFIPYAVTTFFCMLPACIAFIVFSSSLLDLIKGKISPGLIIGIFLIILVSLIPVIIQKFKPRQNSDLEIS
ncbi:MAG: VTT domain-containing protein [Desulfobacterales bacterium]|jgi:uncharacterized membrane protein YdjX (TVP38/TMEM64 family)/Fe-S oxidoreductase|nr:VTT domain-containing protein [Desulfobacterales bacterium]